MQSLNAQLKLLQASGLPTLPASRGSHLGTLEHFTLICKDLVLASFVVTLILPYC